jgi:tetratricopeptide (TPR) repeat protein
LTLGFLQSQAQDPAASLATYRDSQTNFVQCSGQDSPEALTAAAGVGGAMFFAGQPENAVPLLESTTQKMLALFGPGDPRLIPALAPLAGAYSATGRFKQAEDTSLRVLPLSVTLKNHRELVTGLCHLNLARALEGEGRYAEALQHAELAEKAYAAESDRTPMVIANGQNAHQLSLDLKVKQNLPRK